MTTVQSKIVAPDGTGRPGWVVVRLVGPGLQPDSRVSVLAPLNLRVEGDGAWSADLLPNTGSSPYYLVTEAPDAGIPRQRLIHVEDESEPVWLASLVVALPLPVGMDGLPYRGPEGPPGPPGEMDAASFGAAVAAEVAEEGSATRANVGSAAVSAVEGEAVVEPTGSWNFTQTPTVNGVAIGTGGGGGTGGAVDSVNGQTGAVSLTAVDVGAATMAQVQALLADYVPRSELVIGGTAPANPTTGTIFIDNDG